MHVDTKLVVIMATVVNVLRWMLLRRQLKDSDDRGSQSSRHQLRRDAQYTQV